MTAPVESVFIGPFYEWDVSLSLWMKVICSFIVRRGAAAYAAAYGGVAWTRPRWFPVILQIVSANRQRLSGLCNESIRRATMSLKHHRFFLSLLHLSLL
jgi:hypothetical protein